MPIVKKISASTEPKTARYSTVTRVGASNRVWMSQMSISAA